MYFAEHLPLTTGLQRDAIPMQRVQLGVLMSATPMANNTFCNLIIFLQLCVTTLWSLFCLHRLKGTFCIWEGLQTICLSPANLPFAHWWSHLWTTILSGKYKLLWLRLFRKPQSNRKLTVEENSRMRLPFTYSKVIFAIWQLLMQVGLWLCCDPLWITQVIITVHFSIQGGPLELRAVGRFPSCM